jgi:nucleoside-diphosphate-sugar epimerase
MRICILGGGGYVGTTLVPRLLKNGHEVVVVDTFWFGDHLKEHPYLLKIKGDIRSASVLSKAMLGADAVIHLACISNDPSFDMNPKLGKEINYDCFTKIIHHAELSGVSQFIYASSSSVYGVSDLKHVQEDTPKNPLTDYSKYKLACEQKLEEIDPAMNWTIVRPSTVCGYSPRLRLDLVVNILTMQALTKKRITLFGGEQKRPNIHVIDMARAYELILDNPALADRNIYNVGFENHTLFELAEMVKEVVGEVPVDVMKTDDLRSYHVSSSRIKEGLGFKPKYSIQQAIGSLKMALESGQITDPLTNPIYHNIKRMAEIKII